MNNQITPVDSTLLRNKLGRLAIRLQSKANPKGTDADFNTLEKVLSESVRILSQFYKQLSEPTYVPRITMADTVPDAEGFNNNFIGIQDDLETIFSEFENLEGVVLGNFNYMASRMNRLNRKLKSISSQLGDFILFADLVTKDALFFSDSFNNLSRVEVNSPLLNNDQCEINQVEGIVTLPIDRTAQSTINITEVPVINSNSNGVVGNNYEAGAALHGSISDILDNNADTWFEYERVVTNDDGKALVLDFTINMGELKVINFVRLNPNNFGTKTQVNIKSIETSEDGKDFVSIKDDIPIAGFTTEDEANVFVLAPSTSKFAGQGLFTFTPREAKYVHITLEQTTPYTITTSAGLQRNRYAIGIRDVDIQALPYKKKGELISSEYKVTDDIRKVVLLSNQNPREDTVSALASIDHFISPDNGVTWYQIRPKASSGVANTTQAVPELINFNGPEKDAVSTTSDVKSLRYKAVLARNTSGFSSASSDLAQAIESTTELHSPPTTTPFTINLQNTPVSGTLKLIDPQFGSRGKSDIKYQIAVGTGAKQSILLPFKPMKRDLEKYLSGGVYYLRDKNPEEIYVDGTLWARTDVLAGTDNEYVLNYEEGRLDFGDGTNGNAVAQGSTISMLLSEERIFPGKGVKHLASLDYPTSNDKKQAEVSIVKPATSKTQVLAKGATRFQLEPDILYDTNTGKSYLASELYTITISDGTVFATEKIFGTDTLSGAGDWYIDFENGMLYCYTPTNTSTETIITYHYYPRIVLTEDEWDFVDGDDGIANAISISDDKYQTFEADTFDVPDTVKYFNLPHFGIAQGTVVFSSDPTLATEVQFVDGRTELLGAVRVTQALDAIGAGGTVSIPFTMKISTDTGFSVSFSRSDVFQSEVGSKAAVDSGSAGDYWIDRTVATSLTGRIYVKLSGAVASPGDVTYSYANPQAVLTGRYSINYETGEVFTYTPTGAGITADYEYTDYRIKYDIARLVSSDDWQFDSSTDKITISDREILRSARTPQKNQGSATSAQFYQASYDYVKSTRSNVSALEPYFSPVLKDYALKVITKSRLS